MGSINFSLIIHLFSGLALFLYGMNMMSAGLESVAGSKMKKIVGLFTKNKFIGVMVGAFVTAIVQSSSAATVMVVGFVNAGIMNLSQAVGLIMGANIGTTITGQMVSFKLTELAPYAIVIGVVGLFFINYNRTKEYFRIILGFGILFLGMHEMSASMVPIREIPEFKELVVMLASPGVQNVLLGTFVGFAFTAIVQSSSATTALLVTMATEGTISIAAAFPMILGANIGTTVTAMLSGIGANKNAKKAAIMHLLFNVIGSLFFLILFILFRNKAVDIMTSLGSNAQRQIANTHTVFNVVNTLMLLPFSALLVKMANRIIPTTEEEEQQVRLDDRMIETPSVALQVVKNEIDRMGKMALQSFDNSLNSFIKKDWKLTNRVFKDEKVINEMESTIGEFLVKLSNADLNSRERSFIDNMFNVLNDIERIGDHADNIAELSVKNIEEKLVISEQAIEQLVTMGTRVNKSVKQALEALSEEDKAKANMVIEREGEIDYMEKQLRKEHIKRLNDKMCIPTSGVIFLDVISNLERIGDHASNIALYVSDIE